MINPVLERRFADCSELVEAWKAYLEYFKDGVKNENFESTPAKEQQFLDCKARIAMLHDSFMESLKHDQSVGQNMLSIVNRSITLKHLRNAGAADQKKIEIEWHEVYLLLNESVSNLSDERDRLAGVNEMTFKMGKLKARMMTNFKAFTRSVWFKLALSVAIVIAIIIGVPLTGLYHWDNLRTLGGIGKPYAAFVDIKRDTLGFSGPYSSLDIYKSNVEKSLPPDYSIEESSTDKNSFASSFETSFQVKGEDAASFLKTAEGFASYRVNDPQSGFSPNAAIFYWFHGTQSADFVRALRDAANNDNQMALYFQSNYAIGSEENVLIFVDGPETRETILRRVFK